MNNQDFFAHRRELNRLAGKILNEKGPAYAGVDEDGEEDRFTNFKVIALLNDLYNVESSEPLGTWAVYFLKHVLAILSYIGNGVTSEGGIINNFADARNYLDLGYGLSCEREEEARCCPEGYAPCGSDDDYGIPFTPGETEDDTADRLAAEELEKECCPTSPFSGDGPLLQLENMALQNDILREQLRILKTTRLPGAPPGA